MFATVTGAQMTSSIMTQIQQGASAISLATASSSSTSSMSATTATIAPTLREQTKAEQMRFWLSLMAANSIMPEIGHYGGLQMFEPTTQSFNATMEKIKGYKGNDQDLKSLIQNLLAVVDTSNPPLGQVLDDSGLNVIGFVSNKGFAIPAPMMPVMPGVTALRLDTADLHQKAQEFANKLSVI